jgi:hypothetical protein
MPGGNRYQEVRPITRAKAEVDLVSAIPSTRIDALLSLAYHDPELDWVQDRCIQFTEDPDPGVRRMAVLCFGHLARIHQKLDLDRVLPILHRLVNDPLIAGDVNDTLDDIEVFLDRR